ncbi:DHA2 family efflux MFS transporter permease subunit [Nocardia macrotermitis]|uniref:Multidrug resistance protein Stp n=1 Tax=Nocardia macrotermitis TaxID=2585198 RepID=A0A7K0DA04_9NOCA|nr:DHA2 family efflux MFS transporter permease subunit [Nocardia macrotermitis]MQY22603.1 Multidrug resistance protein Stp [Nocardia macrotermitis]
MTAPTSSSPPTASKATAGITLLLTSAATFMAFLDTTVVNVAFPALHTDFPKASVELLTWVVTSYAVLFAALLTSAGRFADVVGRKAIFLGAVLLFTIASLACALAPTSSIDYLIAARAVQGIGAAGMIPAALGLVLAETPAAKRAEAIGIWGAAGSIAAAAGPSLGGVLVSEINWRAVFILNIPIGLAVLIGGLRALPNRPSEDRRRPDLVGTVGITLGIALTVLGMTEGGDWGWRSLSTWGCIAAGVVLMALSLWRSTVHSAPAIEVELWRSRMFASANAVSFLLGAGLFVWFLSGPLFLTTIWHYSILSAGLAVTPGAVASAIAAIVIGRSIPPERQRPVIVISLLLYFGLSVWAYLALSAKATFWSIWLPYGTLGGLAIGAALTSVTTAASISVHPLKFGSGTGLNTMARQFGGAIGVAAMAAVFAAHKLWEPQAYLDVFLLAGLFVLAAVVPALLLFRKPDMAAIAERQQQIEQFLAAQAAQAAAQAQATPMTGDAPVQVNSTAPTAGR